MGDKCLCVPNVGLCVLGSDLLRQGCCARKPYKVLNSFGQPCPSLQFWDMAGSGLRVLGWPRRVLGNGYGRKLSQPGRCFCGNRKELGAVASAGRGSCTVLWAGGQHRGCVTLPEPRDVAPSACSG